MLRSLVVIKISTKQVISVHCKFIEVEKDVSSGCMPQRNEPE